MYKVLRLLAILILINCAVNSLYGQKKDTSLVGSATGILRDSTHNYVLEAGTVSVYKIKDDELLSYQLSNSFGRFNFKRLPVGVPLRIVVTFIGYNPAVKDFVIPIESNEINLQVFNLTQTNILLTEVRVSGQIPPMQMRGDTLEFNAGAFKLDSNAVVEDLLRKIPGITVWNDGVITVNGKRVKKLLVEGKEFFGGDTKIATQNLAKSAVQKIQVYQNKNDLNPSDSTTNMNVILKKEKKNGYFGKVGGGIGTDKHYEGNGMISVYSPKLQLSLVGAINDVNRTANSVGTMVALNSFKGEGVENDYYSDFTKQGKNIFKAAGFSVLYDLSKKIDSETDESSIKSNYYVQDAINTVTQKTKTLVTLSPVEHLNQTAAAYNNAHYVLQNTEANYIRKYDHSSFDLTYYMQNNKISNDNIQENTSNDNLSLIQSENSSRQHLTNSQNVIGGKFRFVSRRYQDLATGFSKSLNMELEYSFETNNSNDQNKYLTNFIATDTTQNKYFNRNYILALRKTIHTIITNFDDISRLIQNNIPYFQIDIKNTVSFNREGKNNSVSDFPKYGTSFNPNNYLSNISSNQITEDKPAIKFSKIISQILDNRYDKTINLSFYSQADIYFQENKSQKDFQNLSRSYLYFTPSAQFSYANFQFGGSRQSYSLNYVTSVNFPTIYQLAPLIDNINVYSIIYGNVNLKPAYKHNLSIHYNYDSGIEKNALLVDVDFSAGLIDHFISDSSYYDALGRTVHYPVNVSGNRYAFLNASLNKAFKLQDNQFQILGNIGITSAQYPSSFNGKYYLTKIRSFKLAADLVYTYKANFTADIGASYFGDQTEQEDLSRYGFYNWRTYSNIIVSLYKRLSLGTRVDFNSSKSTNSNTVCYSIWNIDAAYRFLKGSNFEIRLSALDLLHQNKTIINYVTSNSITSGTVNVLQQYFMVTLAYYPRKFGF